MLNPTFQYITLLVIVMAAEIAAAVIVLIFKDEVCAMKFAGSDREILQSNHASTKITT